MDYKIGDRVMCIHDHVNPSNVGKIGIILEIGGLNGNNGRAIKIRWKNGGTRILWEKTEMILYTPLHEVL